MSIAQSLAIGKLGYVREERNHLDRCLHFISVVIDNLDKISPNLSS